MGLLHGRFRFGMHKPASGPFFQAGLAGSPLRFLWMRLRPPQSCCSAVVGAAVGMKLVLEVIDGLGEMRELLSSSISEKGDAEPTCDVHGQESLQSHPWMDLRQLVVRLRAVDVHLAHEITNSTVEMWDFVLREPC